MFQKVKDEFGRLDIVMSNSGIEHFGDLESVTDEEIDKVLGVNVKAQFVMAQQAYKNLEDEGRLILISSISAVWGVPRHALYSASKAAVHGMVKCLAWDFGSRGITVNCIAPGGVKTDMYAEAAAKYLKGGDKMSIEEVDGEISEISPLGRPGFPMTLQELLPCWQALRRNGSLVRRSTQAVELIWGTQGGAFQIE
ncbi:hypothetical protein FOIG_16534 [Fusarium odoratissimum NRRL 54006]|nr:uncharacterized protein FOIG_16534 [Fusarium odoratissimum NRRL 54006]EXL90197.1 hypothetical protein FOIG_16534 [Fusarium odoratissimum NRRL 54006]